MSKKNILKFNQMRMTYNHVTRKEKQTEIPIKVIYANSNFNDFTNEGPIV